MIRFKCEHCERMLRVSDAFGGMKGKCPECEGIVAIPESESDPNGAQSASAAPEREPSGDEPVRKRTAVVHAEVESDDEDRPVPPPPSRREPSLDVEAAMNLSQVDRSAETDALPALNGEEMEEPTKTEAESPQPDDEDRQKEPTAGAPHLPIGVRVVLITVLLAIAAGGFALVILWP